MSSKIILLVGLTVGGTLWLVYQTKKDEIKEYSKHAYEKIKRFLGHLNEEEKREVEEKGLLQLELPIELKPNAVCLTHPTMGVQLDPSCIHQKNSPPFTSFVSSRPHPVDPSSSSFLNEDPFEKWLDVSTDKNPSTPMLSSSMIGTSKFNEDHLPEDAFQTFKLQNHYLRKRRGMTSSSCSHLSPSFSSTNTLDTKEIKDPPILITPPTSMTLVSKWVQPTLPETLTTKSKTESHPLDDPRPLEEAKVSNTSKHTFLSASSPSDLSNEIHPTHIDNVGSSPRVCASTPWKELQRDTTSITEWLESITLKTHVDNEEGKKMIDIEDELEILPLTSSSSSSSSSFSLPIPFSDGNENKDNEDISFHATHLPPHSMNPIPWHPENPHRSYFTSSSMSTGSLEPTSSMTMPTTTVTFPSTDTHQSMSTSLSIPPSVPIPFSIPTSSSSSSSSSSCTPSTTLTSSSASSPSLPMDPTFPNVETFPIPILPGVNEGSVSLASVPLPFPPPQPSTHPKVQQAPHPSGLHLQGTSTRPLPSLDSGAWSSPSLASVSRDPGGPEVSSSSLVSGASTTTLAMSSTYPYTHPFEVFDGEPCSEKRQGVDAHEETAHVGHEDEDEELDASVSSYSMIDVDEVRSQIDEVNPSG